MEKNMNYLSKLFRWVKWMKVLQFCVQNQVNEYKHYKIQVEFQFVQKKMGKSGNQYGWD